MKQEYAVLINDILQQFHFDAEHSGTNDTLSLGMAFIALQFVAKRAGDTVAENEIGQMVADCRKGVIPKPACIRSDVMFF
ncbi:hypothetical protein IFU02_019990 [Pantoea agglomerans]|uniref:hypothetical protein n=1 Tax=Enterobacter agglomerans TaxID=549 RepID=UPI0017849CAD|nr:hypothetical protein [Pantoea agglomerans]WVL84725.1 hypothetical protein IFU02_019990 [Pantoea agglomerans]